MWTKWEIAEFCCKFPGSEPCQCQSKCYLGAEELILDEGCSGAAAADLLDLVHGPRPSFQFHVDQERICHLSLQYRIVGICHLVTLAQWPAASIDMSSFISRYMHAAPSGHSDYRLHVPLQFCILLSPPRSAQHRVIPNLDPEYNSPHPAPIRPYTLHQDGQHRHPHPHPSFRSQNVHSYSQL